MTLYKTDGSTADESRPAADTNKIVAVNLYLGAGATTNSDSGVTKFDNIDSALAAMSQVGMLLLVLDEVTDPSADLFDREATFVEKVIKPIVAKFPQLKVGREHITSKEATEFLPVLKHETHLQTLLQAVASGGKKFYSERTAHPT
ncbi:hypothetical protein PR003_g4464 [Phytophthora rubi]|uniref:Uncharacterized protein n=1 Tax=Phytophthora rubi TaxID=129364 RepID=A0A6A3NLZ0_9STRA|nr:hypothetical protein PR002_g6220 [Phytophthora rubi]KAE9043342.1 hypothetical protein PR001_g5833 [Phytophthora rubi]KAE9352268.1 hypothetical protein PR003_g4464 [Phytophthora rubi]